jgi:hypothetical protein
MNDQHMKFFKMLAVLACVFLGLIAYQFKTIAHNTGRFGGGDPVPAGGMLRVTPAAGDSRVNR